MRDTLFFIAVVVFAGMLLVSVLAYVYDIGEIVEC